MKLNIYIYITKSSRLQTYDLLDGKKCRFSFGHSVYEDYTIHKDYDRKKRCMNRHAKHEDWHKSGLHTAGFWSRRLLWNLPTLKDIILDANERFNLNSKLI